MAFHDCRFIDEALTRVNLVKARAMMRGFGFSLLRREVLPEPLGIALHYRLQHLADQDMPILRSSGMAYFVLARKSVLIPLASLPSMTNEPSLSSQKTCTAT